MDGRPERRFGRLLDKYWAKTFAGSTDDPPAMSDITITSPIGTTSWIAGSVHTRPDSVVGLRDSRWFRLKPVPLDPRLPRKSRPRSTQQHLLRTAPRRSHGRRFRPHPINQRIRRQRYLTRANTDTSGAATVDIVLAGGSDQVAGDVKSRASCAGIRGNTSARALQDGVLATALYDDPYRAPIIPCDRTAGAPPTAGCASQWSVNEAGTPGWPRDRPTPGNWTLLQIR